MMRLIEAAMAADAEWSAELVKVFGNNAGDARFDARGFSTARLLTLKAAKIAADDACYTRRLPRAEVEL